LIKAKKAHQSRINLRLFVNIDVARIIFTVVMVYLLLWRSG